MREAKHKKEHIIFQSAQCSSHVCMFCLTDTYPQRLVAVHYSQHYV